MPTFGSWEWTVLDEAYDNIDYLSLHRYYGNPHNDTPDFLASTMDLDDFIKTVAAVSRGMKGKKHSRHTVNLSLDEWNVWYHSGAKDAKVYREIRGAEHSRFSRMNTTLRTRFSLVLCSSQSSRTPTP